MLENRRDFIRVLEAVPGVAVVGKMGGWMDQSVNINGQATWEEPR